KRLRRSIYQAAFSASQRWNPILLALYKRLIAKGKHHKVATVACARKLVEIANAILARATPWQNKAVTP
ncbi:MAG TPA: IS110 family transposase, partial [Hypericibacter adhaerens]|nr:IS110 family transposase [Hypericibacter adhaerens]